jgi:hypothetical protein
MSDDRVCVVMVIDAHGVEHSVKVRAESVYEAAPLGLNRLERGLGKRWLILDLFFREATKTTRTNRSTRGMCISDFKNSQIDAIEISFIRSPKIPSSDTPYVSGGLSLVLPRTRRRHPHLGGSAKGPAHQLITQVVEYIRHSAAKR